VANIDAPDNVIRTFKVAVITNTENNHHHHHLKKQGTRFRPRSKDTNKMNYEGVIWIQHIQDRIQWWAFVTLVFKWKFDQTNNLPIPQEDHAL
jgi:hypothetical protein